MTARPMTEELEPCPFCGSPFAELTLFDTPHNERWWRVECQSCCAKSQGAKYPAVAATSWNRRSTSAAVRGMREALEMAEGTLLIASRMLTEDHKMALNGRRWGDKTIKAVNAALSGIEGEDEQARGQGRSESTD